jgi:signal transduction histidine kinase
MKGWWSDTLFKRLFLLLWVGLVVSHLIAFTVTTRVYAPPQARPGAGAMPVLPSLPPMGLGPGEPTHHGPPPQSMPAGPPPGPDLRRPPEFAGPPGGLQTGALWLDYGVRVLAIGVAAWFGARWLSSPMRRLAAASENLGRALGQGRRAPRLDEQRGTLEVRQTAHVFNAMAERLHAQFDAQGLLMAAISHDLRTPLARLRMRIEMMEAQPQSERCIADVREMDALIDSVLDLLRAPYDQAERERVDLTALVQARVDDLIEQGHPVGLTGPPPQAAPVVVLGQAAALNRLIDNLIANALRHGGSAQVSVTAHAGEVQVAIDDRGPGIPEHQLDAVFQPFYRVDTSRSRDTGGSGLGLYIARDLAQRHGGGLTLANRAVGGLRATLTLPLA